MLQASAQQAGMGLIAWWEEEDDDDENGADE